MTRKWLNLFETARRKWRHHSKAEKVLFFEAFLWLGLSRLALKLSSFKKLISALGCYPADANAVSNEPPPTQEGACQVGWAVRAAARHTPWQSRCVVQAITVQKMLRRRAIAGIIFLGVAPDTDNPSRLKAHAWVRSGDTILTGAAGYRRFTIVSTFIWSPHSQTD